MYGFRPPRLDNANLRGVVPAVEKVDHTSILHDSHGLKWVLNVYQVS